MLALGLGLLGFRWLTRAEAPPPLAWLFADAPANAPAAPSAREGAVGGVARGASATEVGPPLDGPLLATVRDNTVFRDAEAPAWFALIARLRDGPPLPRASVGAPVAYAQLVAQPDDYRGRVVEVVGVVRRVERVTPADNSLGLNTYYRVIVQPTGGPGWPLTVYALRPPAGVPLEADVSLPVRLQGAFFKNLSYMSKSGMGVTPVLVALEIPTPQLPSGGAEPRPRASIGAVATVVLLVGVGWAWLRGRRRVGPRGSQPGGPKPDFSRFDAEGPS